MEVGEEDVLDVRQPHAALQLPLRPLAAVEQQPFAAARDEHAGGRPRTVGTAPAVPRKRTERSMAAYLRGRGGNNPAVAAFAK